VEFGHLRLERPGTTVESKCSGWAVDAKIRHLASGAPESLLARLTAQSVGGEAVTWQQRCAKAMRWRTRSWPRQPRTWLLHFSHAIHLLHPAILVMGGGLALVGEPLRAAIATALPRFVMAVFLPPPRCPSPGSAKMPCPSGRCALRPLHRARAANPLDGSRRPPTLAAP